jgi:hypothetical protein
VDLVDVFGGVDAGRLEIDALQNIERLQQDRPLVPRSGLVDVVAVKVRRGRLFDLAVERGEVVVG